MEDGGGVREVGRKGGIKGSEAAFWEGGWGG